MLQWMCLTIYSSSFTKRIVELAPDESDAVLDYLFRHVSENHDFQVGHARSRFEYVHRNFSLRN